MARLGAQERFAFLVPVRDWNGQLQRPENVPFIIASQVGSLLRQMLYLRRLVVRVGMANELTPERTSAEKWYPFHFKNRPGPALMDHLKSDAPSPIFGPGKKPPSLFTLGQLFQGASRYRDDDLVTALAEFGGTEAGLRGKMATETLAVWVTRAVADRAEDRR